MTTSASTRNSTTSADATLPHWADRLTERDLTALTPLIWEHVNPYGRFELDMEARITALE